MEIFKIHNEIIGEYESYIKSFINISNKKINDVVRKELGEKKFWPDSLIQFNSSFEYSESLPYLINENIIHKDFTHIFKGYNIFKNQIETIKLGVNKEDFIVTSGTGSGKSLTYLTTIFDRILNQKSKTHGIKAIVVYPMNALINSQTEEIKKYADNYKKSTSKDFPVIHAQYKGQEDQETRDNLKQNPLPENDRIRYTIHSDARIEILKCIPEFNPNIHEEEVAAGFWNEKNNLKKSKGFDI